MNDAENIPRVEHWIGGQCDPSATSYTDSLNPIDDSVFCRVAVGVRRTIGQAVQAADLAFADYRKTGPAQREEWLIRAADLLGQRSDQLVEALVDEIGSPITKARREVSTAVSILRAAAGATRHVTGHTYPTDIPGRTSFSIRRPLGVIAGMTPFNVPLIKLIKHSAMPLATGNTVVILPSEETPFVANLVAQLYAEAGFPEGSFNIVYGSGEAIGDFLTTHPQVKGIGFTGSARVGRHVQALCGVHGKRVTLELGGKNPLVVLNDADLSKAIPGCVVGSFLYQGQICMSSSRIFVERDIAETFMEKFTAAASNLGQGDLRDPQTMVGPIINARQRERVKAHIDDAIQKGAQLVCGNEWNGNILSPTILTNITPSMMMHDEETFGPVTTVQVVSSPEEAISLANQSAYGLCGSIFTNQLDRAMAFAEMLEAGMVHINATTIQEEAHVPFGGVKQSGFGREGTMASIDELTEWKWVTIQ